MEYFMRFGMEANPFLKNAKEIHFMNRIAELINILREMAGQKNTLVF